LHPVRARRRRALAVARSATLQLKTALDETTLAIALRVQRRPIGSVNAITGSAPGLIDNRIDPRRSRVAGH